ncbi:ankyrin repeat domain-containing protein [Thiotrichales bacterium 19S9-12]|nr:ankyrin repeat domain-containing protein [Thiotrichales bacterium 19S9-11]MCF6812406.1 ankyrin repeat domain-containing protein [Thiotrichales bacterium 19S9-12]
MDPRLYKAIIEGKPNIVRELLNEIKDIKDINERYQLGFGKPGPLHLTLLEVEDDDARFSILEALLNHPNINVNQQGPMKKTPLFIAVEDGLLPEAKLLLQYNADPSITNSRKRFPLDAAKNLDSVLDKPIKKEMITLLTKATKEHQKAKEISALENNSKLISPEMIMLNSKTTPIEISQVKQQSSQKKDSECCLVM